MILRFLIGLASGLLDVYKLLIIAYVVLSWMRIPANRWTELLRSVIEPALTPVRRLLAKYLPREWQKLDWSPVALYLIITVIQWLLC
ncbi:MAG: YggT family protein [Clostridia bacterium]|nr:YggT family protein [Clostridia bacterium]